MTFKNDLKGVIVVIIIKKWLISFIMKILKTITAGINRLSFTSAYPLLGVSFIFIGVVISIYELIIPGIILLIGGAVHRGYRRRRGN